MEEVVLVSEDSPDIDYLTHPSEWNSSSVIVEHDPNEQRPSNIFSQWMDMSQWLNELVTNHDYDYKNEENEVKQMISPRIQRNEICDSYFEGKRKYFYYDKTIIDKTVILLLTTLCNSNQKI